MGIVGLAILLVKDNGPVQLNVAPAVEEVAIKFKVLPEHNGLLLFMVGVIGGVGSNNVNVPAMLETHPFNVAVIFE